MVTAGFAIGFGADRTSIGTDGTSSGADNVSGTAYVSYRPYGSIYIDALTGYGMARFTSNRFDTMPGVLERGARKGSEVYGALEITSEQRWNAWQFAPYTRLQFIDARLDAFTETGDPTWALSYANVSMHEVSGVLGFHVDYDLATSWGVLTPTLRAEYTRAFNTNLTQAMSYASTPGVSYAFTVAGLAPNTLSGTLGLAAHYKNGATATIEYQLSTAGSFGRSQGLRATLNIPFSSSLRTDALRDQHSLAQLLCDSPTADGRSEAVRDKHLVRDLERSRLTGPPRRCPPISRKTWLAM